MNIEQARLNSTAVSKNEEGMNGWEDVWMSEEYEIFCRTAG